MCSNLKASAIYSCWEILCYGQIDGRTGGHTHTGKTIYPFLRNGGIITVILSLVFLTNKKVKHMQVTGKWFDKYMWRLIYTTFNFSETRVQKTILSKATCTITKYTYNTVVFFLILYAYLILLFCHLRLQPCYRQVPLEL